MARAVKDLNITISLINLGVGSDYVNFAHDNYFHNKLVDLN